MRPHDCRYKISKDSVEELFRFYRYHSRRPPVVIYCLDALKGVSEHLVDVPVYKGIVQTLGFADADEVTYLDNVPLTAVEFTKEELEGIYKLFTILNTAATQDYQKLVPVTLPITKNRRKSEDIETTVLSIVNQAAHHVANMPVPVTFKWYMLSKHIRDVVFEKVKEEGYEDFESKVAASISLFHTAYGISVRHNTCYEMTLRAIGGLYAFDRSWRNEFPNYFWR